MKLGYYLICIFFFISINKVKCLKLPKILKNTYLPCRKSERNVQSSTPLVSLFRKVPNYKILSFLPPKVNDKIIIIIIRHLAAEPAQVLWYSRVWWRAFNLFYLSNLLITCLQSIFERPRHKKK
jgi:hypothetical protein